jgi:Lamin Tail Domain
MLSFINVDSFIRRYFSTAFFVSMAIFGNSQLMLDFSNGNLSDPAWQGDVSEFVVNAAEQLQLNTTGAGESFIFTEYKIPVDSIQIDVYFKLQFAPSNDNYSKIYLFIDNPVESLANGYYLRLGENGSNDAIQVWKLSNGVPSLLSTATMGAISADPAQGRIQIKIYRDGFWTMGSDYEGGTLFEEDLMFVEPTFALSDSMYFGIYCKYTSTRSDKFFYDDISIKTIERDTIAPTIASVEVINDGELKVVFSETLDGNAAQRTNNYKVNNNLGSPDQVLFSSGTPNTVRILYNSKKILSSIIYTLTADGVRDKSNNSKVTSQDFVFATTPQKGDVTLTEVLTDPYTGGADFIEIYNKSTKFIALDGVILRNTQNSQSRTIATSLVLKPSQYVAISQDTNFLKSTYVTPSDAQFVQGSLPSLNVSDANITLVSIIDNQEVTIDSFDYQEDFHFTLIDETKGVSLERININGPSNDPNNWHSASQEVLFATPGYKNSNGQTIDPNAEFGFQADKKVISPNGDGNDDFLLLNYKLEKSGYLATIRIYDTEGFLLLNLVDNALLGSEGSLKWDGVDGEGNIMRIGMYIVITKLFHPDGNIKEFKNVVVVGGNL